MKVVRTITYDGDELQLRRQMELSLKDGSRQLLTNITVETTHSDIEGLTGAGEPWHPVVDGDLLTAVKTLRAAQNTYMTARAKKGGPNRVYDEELMMFGRAVALAAMAVDDVIRGIEAAK